MRHLRISLPGLLVLPLLSLPVGLLVALLVGLLVGRSLPGQCLRMANFTTSGKLPTNLPSKALQEVSGLEASRANPDVLWAHDDTGNANSVVAIKTNGALVQEYDLANVPFGDWEDIALGPGPQEGRDYIYIADIGNNNLQFTVFNLIRFIEPLVPKTPGAKITISSYEIFAFKYPGATHDAETLLIDPVDGTPYVLTKEKNSANAGILYQYPLPLDTTKLKTLKLAKTFAHRAPKFSGGDVTSDGKWVLVRNDDTVFAYFRGVSTNAFADAFTSTTTCALAAANQGNAESLTIAENDRGIHLYATSELSGAPIYESVVQLPNGVVAFPSWWNFGSGEPSWLAGMPALAPDRVPAVGSNVSLVVSSARSLSRVAIGLDTQAIPDGVVRLGASWAHVRPLMAVLLSSDANGEAKLLLGTIPNTVALLGFQLHAQAAIDDQAASFWIALTRGLTLQIGL